MAIDRYSVAELVLENIRNCLKIKKFLARYYSGASVSVIVINGDGSNEAIVRALHDGVADAFPKPIDNRIARELVVSV